MVSYLVVLVSWILGLTFTSNVEGNPTVSFLFSLYPFFALCRGVLHLSTTADSGVAHCVVGRWLADCPLQVSE